MSSSGAVSLADIFFTFFPPIAASASSLAFFFSFASVTPSSMVSRVFSAFSFVSFASSFLFGEELLGLLGLLELHVALVSTRSKHDDVPETVYPASHSGWHEDPLASVSVQVPTAPLTMRTLASHAFSLRTQAVGGPSVASSELAYDVNSLHAEWELS